MTDRGMIDDRGGRNARQVYTSALLTIPPLIIKQSCATHVSTSGGLRLLEVRRADGERIEEMTVTEVNLDIEG